MNLNVVVIGGNLTKDIELRYTPSGTAVANLSLALNHFYKQGEERKQEVSYIEVVVFGKTAEACNQYLSKGRPVVVEGRLKQESWQDKEGKKHYRVKVIANSVQFVSKNEDNTQGQS